jgi:hypothetical protein
MEVVVLKAGIFPDAEMVERALLLLPADCTQAVVDVSQAQFGESEWDKVLDRLLAADRIIVV